MRTRPRCRTPSPPDFQRLPRALDPCPGDRGRSRRRRGGPSDTALGHSGRRPRSAIVVVVSAAISAVARDQAPPGTCERLDRRRLAGGAGPGPARAGSASSSIPGGARDQGERPVARPRPAGPLVRRLARRASSAASSSPRCSSSATCRCSGCSTRTTSDARGPACSARRSRPTGPPGVVLLFVIVGIGAHPSSRSFFSSRPRCQRPFLKHGFPPPVAAIGCHRRRLRPQPLRAAPAAGAGSWPAWCSAGWPTARAARHLRIAAHVAFNMVTVIVAPEPVDSRAAPSTLRRWCR